MRLAVALAILIHTTHADAEAIVMPGPAPDAAQLFTEGRELKAAGKIAEACKRFEVSWQAEHAAGTGLNLADCREREGKLLDAWQLFDDAARIFEVQHDSRAEFARNRANAIDARLMSVEVRLAAPVARGVTVTIDGEGALRHRVAPKPMWVRATAPGGKTFAVFVEAKPGKVVIDVPSLVRARTTRNRNRLWIAGGLLAGGVVGLVVGARLDMIADDMREGIEGCDFDESYNGTCINYDYKVAAERTLQLADRNEMVSRIVLGTSVLAVVGAAVVWYTAPKEHVLVTPTATTSSVGVSLVGRF